MLDARMCREDSGTVSVEVYRKKTHTDQYLAFTSNHPLNHKLSVVRTLIDRSNTIVTKQEISAHRKKSTSEGPYRNVATQDGQLTRSKNRDQSLQNSASRVIKTNLHSDP